MSEKDADVLFQSSPKALSEIKKEFSHCGKIMEITGDKERHWFVCRICGFEQEFILKEQIEAEKNG